MEVLDTTVDLGTLQGKSALITGGASGIGLATARAWAAAGMYVTIADIQPLETGQNILADLAGGHVHYVCCDATSWESQITAFKEAIQFTPSKALDIVAAFAGVSFAGGNQVDHVLAAGDPRLDVNPSPRIFATSTVNLIGVYYTSWLGLPKASTYPASKFGVRGLFRSTRARTRELGVRCNLLAPWFIDTPLIAPMKKAMAARGIDMAQRLTFASVDACVEAATTCAANPQLHGRALAILPEGIFDLKDDLEDGWGGDQLRPIMQRRREAGFFVEDLGQTPCLPGKDLDSILAGWGQLAGTLATRYGFPPPDESVATEDVQLDGLWLRCYTPANATGVKEEDGFCRVISRQCQMRLVSVEYRKAPETRYPGALNDGVSAALWAQSRYENQPLVLMGTSAGGNLAFGTALRLIDQDMADKVSGVVALAPITVHPDAVPEHLKEQYTAYEENAELTVNSRAAMQVFLIVTRRRWTTSTPLVFCTRGCLLYQRFILLNWGWTRYEMTPG
ncbi:insect type alcohol dehydrogenase ADH-like classical c SDR [Aspergillus parasiticus SU-1]|nr:insect type alcohol dehydrogenase ADH-like classical c SDR [Aspergillus parasiticus SU-1]